MGDDSRWGTRNRRVPEPEEGYRARGEAGNGLARGFVRGREGVAILLGQSLWWLVSVPVMGLWVAGIGRCWDLVVDFGS